MGDDTAPRSSFDGVAAFTIFVNAFGPSLAVLHHTALRLSAFSCMMYKPYGESQVDRSPHR